MYTYKFVKVKLGNRIFTTSPKQDYKKIIEEHAKDGWRLVQIFDPAISTYGAAAYFELIFEKKAED